MKEKKASEYKSDEKYVYAASFSGSLDDISGKKTALEEKITSINEVNKQKSCSEIFATDLRQAEKERDALKMRRDQPMLDYDNITKESSQFAPTPDTPQNKKDILEMALRKQRHITSSLQETLRKLQDKREGSPANARS